MTKPVDQKSSMRRVELLAKIRQAAPAVATAGSIVESWRTYRGRRLGPYYRLAYRESGIQRSIFIGGDSQLVAAARELLAELQADERARRAVKQMQLATLASLRVAKLAWERELREVGLRRKGFEARGWRRCVKRNTSNLEEGTAAHEYNRR
jgi:hypothetical protein